MESLNASLFKFKIPAEDVQDSSEYEESGSEADVMEDLPAAVVRRIYALEHLQDKRLVLEAEFKKELALLEKKYEDLYDPLYEDRKRIVTGSREVLEEEYKEREESGVSLAEEGTPAPTPKGIPDFWLNVLKRSQLEELVFETDHEALSYLTNIKAERIIDAEAPKLVVSFEFDPNPFFTNAVLTKTVVFNAAGDGVTEMLASPVEWKEGKDLCVSVVEQKMRHRAKPGVTMTKEKTVDQPSFFHFFKSSLCTGEDHEHDEDEHDHPDHNKMMADAEICSFLDKYIIPNAVDWYTTKAQAMFDDDDEFDYDSDEDSDYGDESD